MLVYVDDDDGQMMMMMIFVAVKVELLGQKLVKPGEIIKHR